MNDVNRDQNELRAPLQKIQDQKSLVGAEIGVYKGEHARKLLENLDIRKLFLIDPYTSYGDYDGEHDGLRNDKLEVAKREAEGILYPYERDIIWIKDFSSMSCHFIPEEFLDFVYIDGNHTEQACYNDIRNYYPLVREGGLIARDDYREELDGRVADAVHKFVKDYEIDDFSFDYTQWWFFKSFD